MSLNISHFWFLLESGIFLVQPNIFSKLPKVVLRYTVTLNLDVLVSSQEWTALLPQAALLQCPTVMMPWKEAATQVICFVPSDAHLKNY